MHLGISSPELSAVILAALLAFLALLVILFFAARYYFRRKMRRWTTQSTALSLQWLPPRIELERRDAPSQAKLDRVARRVAALQELGFEDAGVFRLADEYGLWLQALAHRTTGLTAVVYCLDNVGTWSDVFHVNAANNEVLMASNVRKRFHFIHLPGDRRFHLPDKGEGELVETVLKERGAAASKPVDRESFGAFYERAYARAADTRLLDGWEDYEIRRLLREIEVSEEADAKPTELDEKELGLVKDQLKLIAAEGLRTACVDEFKHSQQVAASEWERARDRVLIVHDRTPLRELLDPGVGVFLTDELESRLRKLKPPFDSPREQFARINAALPPGERYQRIGAVAQPVPADVYRGPLDGLST